MFCEQDRRTRRLLEEMGLNEPDRILEQVGHEVIGLYVSRQWISHLNGEIMARFAWSLLARVFRRLALVVDPDTESDVSAPLQETLFKEAEDLGVEIVDGQAISVSLVLSIGHAKIGSRRVYISSNGWVAEVSENPLDTETLKSQPNPIGAMTAACLGVAWMFKCIMREHLRASRIPFGDTSRIRFNALTYRDQEQPNPPLKGVLDVQDLTLIGCGAVGVAFIAALSQLKPKGHLTVIDSDRIDVTNLNRYVFITRRDVGKPKVQVVEDFVRPTGLAVAAFPMTYQLFARRFVRPAGIVICTVDNDLARHEVQSDLPRLILEGATSREVIAVGRYDFLSGACLACVHLGGDDRFAVEEAVAGRLRWSLEAVLQHLETDRPLSDVEATEVGQVLGLPSAQLVGRPLRSVWVSEICGKLTLPETGGGNTGSISFVSALAGVLLAGELIKELHEPNHRVRTSVIMSTLTGPTKHSLQAPSKEPRCSCRCSDPIMQEAYRVRHGLTERKGAGW